MIIDFEYWGNHTYDTETKTLNWVRHCGIFSNVMVMMHSMTDLWLKNMIPENVHTKLTEYNNFDLYDGVFNVNKENLEKWKKFNINNVASTRFNTSPNLYGFGLSKNQIDLTLTNAIIKAYFDFSADVRSRSEELKKQHQIELEDSAFIWWRKTDKIHEITWFNPHARYPETTDVLKFLKPYKNVYMQTDDPVVFNEFSKIKNIKCLDVFNRNKYFTNDDVFKNGFHVDHKDVSDADFKKKYNISRKDYIINLVSLIDIASKSTQFIGYPGNISLFVSLVRNSFDNVVFFKNKEELF